MIMKYGFKVVRCVGLVALFFLNSVNAVAQTRTVEVGSGLINAYVTNPANTFELSQYTRITFEIPFNSTPNVFTMTPEFAGADDPCTIRIRNVSNLSLIHI